MGTWARLQFHSGFTGIEWGGIIGIPGGPFNRRHEPFKRREKPGRRVGRGVVLCGLFFSGLHGHFISFLCISTAIYKVHGLQIKGGIGRLECFQARLNKGFPSWVEQKALPHIEKPGP
jgi:hypothetical protein